MGNLKTPTDKTLALEAVEMFGGEDVEATWLAIDDLLDAHDGHLKLDVASACCWSGELRIGLTNPDNAPARSAVFFAAGGASPTANRPKADPPPENAKPRPCVSPQEAGRTAEITKHPLDSKSSPACQALPNGRAGAHG